MSEKKVNGRKGLIVVLAAKPHAKHTLQRVYVWLAITGHIEMHEKYSRRKK